MTNQRRAAVYENFEGPSAVTVTSTDIPDLQEGEVLVRVQSAGVNPVDAAVTQGYLKERIPHQMPVIPGWDLAGVVEDRGFAARRFEVGDEVYGYARRPVVQQGTFTEYVVIPDSYLSLQPENITAEEAGAIPLTGLTAWQSLYEAGELQEGETVLILGASGGVGSFGIQLAKAKGARVIGVASEKNHDHMVELGADRVVDYHDTHVGSAVKGMQPDGVDLIFDCAAGETLNQSLSALKADGKLVSILSQGEDLDPEIDHAYVFVEPNVRQLDRMREMVEAGEISVPVSRTYPLEKAPEALEQIQSLHTRGKIVITPQGEPG